MEDIDPRDAEIERLRTYIKKLERRIHNQRVNGRLTWEIVEMRRKWLGSDTARQKYCALLKRYQTLLARLREHGLIHLSFGIDSKK